MLTLKVCMHLLKLKIRGLQTLSLRTHWLWHAAFKSTFPAILLFVFKEIKVTLICRLNNVSEKRAHKDICFPKPPGLEQNLWQTCSGTFTSGSFCFSLHHFAPPTVRWCQSACFPIESSSACYHKCPCVLTISAGVCSGKELNDQQALTATTVQMDASTPKLLIYSTMSQQFPGEGGRQDGGTEERKCRGVERLHGA